METIVDDIWEAVRVFPQDGAEDAAKLRSLTLRFLGTRDERERYLLFARFADICRVVVVEFAGNFKQCGHELDIEWNYEPMYERLD